MSFSRLIPASAAWLKVGKMLALVVPLAAIIGSSVAFFLWSLDRATLLRFQHPALLYFLPAGGLIVGLLYHHFGKASEQGTHLIMEEIHQPGGGVPARMASLVLLTTLLTHLFGGSAGREGTAVQIGGSIAAFCGRQLQIDSQTLRILLMTGIAAGFGAVFGTPLAGSVFALEVARRGGVKFGALLPCLLAALVGHWTCRAWGIVHTAYQIRFALPGHFHLEAPLLAKVVLASAAFGLVSWFFLEVTLRIQSILKRWITFPPFRPVIGGLVVVGLVFVLQTRDYLGLGVTSPIPGAVTLVSFFTSPEVHPWAWLGKLIFTAVTLGSGLKGGEVTPLFFIGAALGNMLSGLLHAPPDLLAALGFVAIFAGASNTPFASTLLGLELFGSQHFLYIAVACFVAYFCSGPAGIYHPHRRSRLRKGDQPPDIT